MARPRLFQLIDFDRTLFDTEKFAAAIAAMVDEVEPGLGVQLDAQFEAAYKKEETFFMLRFLRERFGDKRFEQFVRDAVEKVGAEKLMLPGARERLALAEQLTELRPAYGIISYGDPKDQLLKLTIAGLQDAPLLITETPDKGPVIASWQQADGTFVLPAAFGEQVADELTFEDDKLRAFDGLPGNTLGIWIHKEDGRTIHNAGRVERRNSLRASIRLLEQKYL